MEPKIKIQDYTYNLPEDRIAKYPLEKRDASKILIFKNNIISESKFSNLTELLPPSCALIFNDTKVVPARLLFKKETGAIIEIFCLEPFKPLDYSMAFSSIHECSWNVVIGNAKRWKNGDIKFFCDQSHAEAYSINLRAELQINEQENTNIVKFKWDSEHTFSQILEICGRIPIPPYLKRDAEFLDNERYQTLYARINGSVAAPTAGLHFTESVLQSLKDKNIPSYNICLHVGAGTFIPVKSEYISDHKMHSEPFTVSKELLEAILNLKEQKQIIAVGTTSTRCLESLYYLGVQCIEQNKPNTVLQWDPYNRDYSYSLKDSIMAILNYMKLNNLDKLTARTSIIIVPGYKFRVIDALITNFHQPQSTLLLLISALIGENWRKVYNYALDNGFRFLSYGDSSILFPLESL